MRQDLHPADACDEARWPFRDFFRSSSMGICPRFPVVPGAVSGGFAPTSFFQSGEFVPVIGPGANGRFEFFLLVKEAAVADLAIELQPRAGSPVQAVQLVLLGQSSQPQIFSARFHSTKPLHFSVQLKADTYRVQIGLVDGEQASLLRFSATVP
jgi:hypothetical protein